MNKCHSLPLFKWSMHQAACLSNRQLPEKWIHLHGTRDLLLPGMFICGAIKVEGRRSCDGDGKGGGDRGVD